MGIEECQMGFEIRKFWGRKSPADRRGCQNVDGMSVNLHYTMSFAFLCGQVERG